MEKLVLSQNGKEVKIGDKITVQHKINYPIKGVVTIEITVNEETLPKLIEEEVIIPIKEDIIPMDLDFYIEKITKKLEWQSSQKTCNYLNNMYKILPSTLLSVILREIAIELDKKYKDHISDSPEIYVISLFDGRITKVNKAHIKNYRNFAAFRNIEDAKIACRIVKPILKEMFKSTSGK